MISNTHHILSTQIVLDNFDTLFPNLKKIEPDDLLDPVMFHLWEQAMQAATDLTLIHKFLKEYNDAKRNNQ